MNARRIRRSSRPASLFRPGPALVAGTLMALGAHAAMILLSGPLPAENPPGSPDPDGISLGSDLSFINNINKLRGF